MPRKPLKGRRGSPRANGESVALVDPIAYTEGYTGELQSTTNAILMVACEGNPQLLSAMQEILNELGRLNVAVYGAPVSAGLGDSTGGITGEAEAPTTFTYQLTKTNIILYWLPATADFQYYELRKGTNWDTADKILVTSTNNVVLNPVLVGTHTYLLKAINANNVASNNTASVTFIVPPIGTFTLVPTVVANAITLAWTIPTSTWRIDYYIIKKDGVTVATNDGTFFAVSEQVGGTYTYSITALDIAGNLSAPVSATIFTTGVTDYIFYSKLSWKKVPVLTTNCKITAAGVYACIITENYQQHFTTRSWASPNTQVVAGYPIWSSPYALTAQYDEEFDFGAPISNVIITIGYGTQQIFGAHTIGFKIWTSVDHVNYAGPFTSTSFLATSMRWVYVEVDMTAGNDKSLMLLTDLFVSLNVKRENDGGEGTAIASDPSGTSVAFKKPFVDVEAITVTPMSDKSYFATHIFSDTAYPTSFAVKVYDNSGVRIGCPFRWNARGIV